MQVRRFAAREASDGVGAIVTIVAVVAIAVLTSTLAVAESTATRPEPIAADIAWVASGEFCEPETVLPLPDDTLLVSNVCDFRERGNGFLTLLGKGGQTLDWRIVEGLDAPLGMALVGDRLYVVDNNRLVVLRWPGYEPLEVIDLNTAVANDVAVAPDGNVYVTDTAGHQVIQRSPDGTQSVRTGDVLTIGPDWLADIDGIELETDGTLQITPVAGPLIRYHGDDDIEILAGDGVSSANHGYAPGLQLALIPTGFDNTVIAIRLTDDHQ